MSNADTIAMPVRRGRPASAGPLRVAVVGCGAVARANLLPVLAGHERVRLAVLVDRSEARARELADAYQVPRVLTDLDLVTAADVDAVVLATPPAHHAPATIACLERGLHVLVEKPMAIRAADAEAMVAAAGRAGLALSVGLYRRCLPSVRLLKHLIETREFGAPLAVDIEEGGPYGWQLATLDVLTREAGGGGVLIDIGSHLIDELLHVVPGRGTVESYEDNSRGGIETDCLLHLVLDTSHGQLPVRMELSRTRELRGSIRVECEDATLELRRPDFTQVIVHRSSRDGQDEPPFTLTAEWRGTGEYVGYQAFRDQIDDWLTGINEGREPVLSGRSVVPVVRTIEECYQKRRDLVEPWTDQSLSPAARPTTPRRVLVTGAGGFLGCRTVEILRERYGWDVVALVRTPASAARLARWPGEIVVGDVCSPDDMRRAVDGCDAVVHCAVGTTWPPDAARKVTVEGTRIAAEAALKTGVRRFVHISTLFVHKRDGGGRIDESVPLEPPAGDGYGHAKLAAEQALRRVSAQGLSAITLRPVRIYGPFSRTFTVRPLEAIGRGQFALRGDPDVPANMVYVDNVVEAIARAVEAPDSLVGSAYLVADEEQVSLRAFYEYFAERAGRAIHLLPDEDDPPAAPPPGLVRQWLSAVRTISTSPQLRALVRKVLDTDPIGTLPRRLWDASPNVQQTLLRRFGADAAVVYRPGASDDRQDLVYYGEAARVSIGALQRDLGFSPVVDRERAMALTLEWARYSGLIR
jgi:predicted dehydrogenase/nucleoside-diphosphate-sugar epimerase